ncbi:MAG: MbnP family copper-binding protein [Alphaproteobacteria bacterium]
MARLRRRLISLVAVAAAATLAACGKPLPSGDMAGENATQLDAPTSAARLRTPGYVPDNVGVPDRGTVAVRFAAVVGDAPFRCGAAYAGIGITASTVIPSDFRLYVYDVALIDDRGRAVAVTLTQDGRWQYRNVALLDFEDGTGPCAGGTHETREVVTGTVPPGRYRGLVFTLGVPPDLNVGSPGLPWPPLADPDLAWPPPGGFRFVKIDMATSGQPIGVAVPYLAAPWVAGAAARPYGFPVHIGGADCPTSGPIPGCAFANRVAITFPDFDPDRDVVLADLRGLLGGSNVDFNTPATPAGCQSTWGDPDCAPIVARIGLSYPGTVPPPQTFFRSGTAR